MIRHAQVMCEVYLPACLRSVQPDAVSGACVPAKQVVQTVCAAPCIHPEPVPLELVEVLERGNGRVNPRVFMCVLLCVCTCETLHECLVARAKQACSRPWHQDQAFCFYLPQSLGLRAPMRLACYSTSFGQCEFFCWTP